MQRKRRVPRSFDWTPVAPDTKRPLPDTRNSHTRIDLDQSGSSTSQTSYISAPGSPTKILALPFDDDNINWNNEPAPPEINTTNYPFLDPAYVHFLDVNEPGPPRRKRTTEDDPLRKWCEDDRDRYLQELLRLDGRGGPDLASACGLCNSEHPRLRCEECFGGSMFCEACLIDSHNCNPLHRIERWNGTFFEHTTLKEIGLRVQLGHRVGEQCSNPKPAAGDNFVVVDTNGVHKIGLDYCDCEFAQHTTTQLLRARWYPATPTAPNTAATFNVLEYFHLLTFESKASVFEFLHASMRRTNNIDISAVPDRYDEFLRMIRQWRHLKMLKRAGRGHDPDGVLATKEGECAVLCPACPQPGKNLPVHWRDAPQRLQFIYSLSLGADANYRMVRKKVSSEEADPTLSPGYSYYCEVKKYNDHLATGVETEGHSTCVNHHAIKDANKTRSANLASTGIGTIDCIRHNFKRPNSVGDLQKGEKYINMDYLFFSSVSHSDFITLTMSYDIVCQWYLHLWERMLTFPDNFQVNLDEKFVTFLVPKFHLPAHVDKCQTAFSFNLTRGVGRTDGEAPERGWSDINPLSSQTKQMGPASRRETIDDHFGDWNHKKVIGMGASLLRKMKNAVPGRSEHVWNFIEFSNSLPADSVLKWSESVERWEKDKREVNPFVATVARVTQHGVRLALAVEDAANLQREDSVVIHDDITPAMLISSGLELESLQIRLKHDSSKLNAAATPLQQAKIQERKNSLHRRINAWTTIQHLYMPEVSTMRARADRAASDTSAEIAPSDFPLHLPSSLPAQTACLPALRQHEFRLREAQAYESLDELRDHLRLRTHMYKYKNKNIVGQRANTRCQNIISTVQDKANTSATKYRIARVAIVKLSPHCVDNEGWRGRLLPLAEEDIRALKEGEEGESEGRRSLSWIWRIVGVGGDSDDEGLQEALRIEWCRSRARAMRWSEEVLFLCEEMRRVLAFLEWHAGWWDERENMLTGLSDAQEGVVAYASKQASIRRSMRTTFEHMWRSSDELVQLGMGADHDVLELNTTASMAMLDTPPEEPSS